MRVTTDSTRFTAVLMGSEMIMGVVLCSGVMRRDVVWCAVLCGVVWLGVAYGVGVRGVV